MLWVVLACVPGDEPSSPELLEVAERRIEGSADRPVGGAVFNVGDLDGDGREDLGLGWPEATDTLEDRSYVGLVTVGSSVETPYATLVAPEWVVSAGECTNPRLHGYTNLVPLGDLDGDGLGELAVGFPGLGAGEVGVFTGAQLAQGGTLQPESAFWRLQPMTGAWSFGVDLAAGDFDGDGVLDLAVSAPKTDEPLYGGEVYTVLGAELAQRDSEMLSVQVLGARVSSPFSGVQFGERIAVVEDIDGDGGDELAVLAAGCSQTPEYGYLALLLSEDLERVGLDREMEAEEAVWSPSRTARLNPFSLTDADGDGRGDLGVGGLPAQDGSTRVRTFAGELMAAERLEPVGEIELGADSLSQLLAAPGPDGVELIGHDGGYVVRVPYPLAAQGWFKEGWIAPCQDQTNEGWMHRLALGDFDGDGRQELAVGEPSWPDCDDGVLGTGVVGLVELD